ncbi:hypothetical protein CASFOL_014321 [Castilleja foliolosa]|uniref:HMA domain-containing protein n=1 Tax=Castilleja foliolosa TaxID=1961234 RepID=A0ABD3DMJ6_9LAMI
MRVHMDCPGCQIKIMKALSKLDESCGQRRHRHEHAKSNNHRMVLKTIRKTGRTAELWPFPYNPEYHDYYNQYYASSTEPPASKYNYYKHGHNGHEHGYYQQVPSLAILGCQ